MLRDAPAELIELSQDAARAAQENLALVKSAGFQVCFSCHGGLVANHADSFMLPRVPISDWYASPNHLAFELWRGSA